jgi:hypothetical protein
MWLCLVLHLFIVGHCSQCLHIISTTLVSVNRQVLVTVQLQVDLVRKVGLWVPSAQIIQTYA